MYVAEFQGIFRDAYDPVSKSISCIVAQFNDPLDASKDNTEFYIHPAKPQSLVIRAATDIGDLEWGYLPYGGPFWCNAAHPIELLLQAIHRYAINIFTSTEETNGAWFQRYIVPHLCRYLYQPLRVD